MKRLYVWLAIFWGFLSVHRILSGNTVEAGIRLVVFLVLMMFMDKHFFFFAVFWLAALIEALGALCMKGFPRFYEVAQQTFRLCMK